MAAKGKDRLIVIGENINTTRRIKATSKNIVQEDGKVGYAYTDLDGTQKRLDITDIFPTDPKKLQSERIGHIGQGIRTKDLDFFRWAIMSQVNAGSHIVDLCVDELSVYPEERLEYMRWTVKAAQEICGDVAFAIDSSDPELTAGPRNSYIHAASGAPAARACMDGRAPRAAGSRKASQRRVDSGQRCTVAPPGRARWCTRRTRG